MLGSDVLDVAIGLFFIFFVAATLSSALVEFIAQILSQRSRQLEQGIAELLEDGVLAKEILRNPLIASLSSGTNSWVKGKLPQWIKNLFDPFKEDIPSYIPSNLFSTALLSVLPNYNGERVKKERESQEQEYKEAKETYKKPPKGASKEAKGASKEAAKEKMAAVRKAITSPAPSVIANQNKATAISALTAIQDAAPKVNANLANALSTLATTASNSDNLNDIANKVNALASTIAIPLPPRPYKGLCKPAAG